jgi:inhibitor of cysteine peptidase
MSKSETHAGSVRVKVGELFTISLAGNPTTGFSWGAEFDNHYLDLFSQAFEHGEKAPGAQGLEVFRFRAQAAGETEIMFAYRRPWRGEAHTKRCFQVVIA